MSHDSLIGRIRGRCAARFAGQARTVTMGPYLIKIVITALVVVAVSEIAKRSTVWAALLASLPLTSLLAFVWLYLETRDSERVAALAHDILWLVVPSLVLFLVLPLLLRAGVAFWVSLLLSCAATAAAYFATVWAIARVSPHGQPATIELTRTWSAAS